MRQSLLALYIYSIFIYIYTVGSTLKQRFSKRRAKYTRLGEVNELIV